jgi:hypothetical protein
MQAQLEALARWSVAATDDFVKTQGVAPGRWLQLERELGTLGACKHLLRDHPESYWAPILQSAYERQRLHWSVEAAALSADFATLFTDAERAVAQRRLAAFGIDVNLWKGQHLIPPAPSDPAYRSGEKKKARSRK